MQHTRKKAFVVFIAAVLALVAGFHTGKSPHCYKKWQSDLDCILEQGSWDPGDQMEYEYQVPLMKSAKKEHWYDCNRPVQKYIWNWSRTNCSKASAIKAFPINSQDKTQTVSLKPIYTREEMCSIMGGRNIMIVGDSINNQLFVTLVSALWPQHVAMNNDSVVHLDNVIIRNAKGAEIGRHIDYGSNSVRMSIPCDNIQDSFHAIFIRNFNLSTNTVVDPEYWKGTPTQPTKADIPRVWFSLIASERIDILLLNRGAHYFPSIDKDAKKTLSEITATYPKLTVIWRNTPAGHKDCGAHLTDPPMSFVDRQKLKTVKKFNWGSISALNYVMREMIQTYFPHVIYLDVEASTALRWDGHMHAEDCLHYCIPGPIDNWVSYLMHALLLGLHYKCSGI